MGYYTKYDLEIRFLDYEKNKIKIEDKVHSEIQAIENSGIKDENLKQKLIEEINNQLSMLKVTQKTVIQALEFNPFEEPCKWYTHSQNMIDLSKSFPGILFILYGSGEDSGDLWVKYFYKGKIQFEEAKIVYEPFDESKLKDSAYPHV